MKEASMVALAFIILVLFGISYALICIIVSLCNHFKANNMTLKERIKLSIKEEFNPPIA